ncbi:MAG: DUF6114 domain-containing protein [Nocardioides sp.]
MNQIFHALARAASEARTVFKAFRHTRPFWGGLWTILAGLWIVKVMSFSMALVLNGGWDYSVGYVLGGALVAFGVMAIVAPIYKNLAGIAAFLVAVAAFPAANLGGFLIGSLVGVFGSSLIWSWGEKAPKKAKKRAGTDPSQTDDATGDLIEADAV